MKEVHWSRLERDRAECIRIRDGCPFRGWRWLFWNGKAEEVGRDVEAAKAKQNFYKEGRLP